MTQSSFRIRALDVMVVLAIVVYGGFKASSRPRATTAAPDSFVWQVDLTPLYRTAVQGDGRLRAFGSHAKTYMGYVSGPRSINGQAAGFTYLDLMFRPERYDDVDLIFVKNKGVRLRIMDALRGDPSVDSARVAAIEKSGLISRRLLRHPDVVALLQILGRDLIRTSKQVDAIGSALTVSGPRFLADTLRLVPPPTGGSDTPWFPLDDLIGTAGAPQDDVHAGVVAGATIPGLAPELRKQLAEAVSTLQAGWLAEDAAKVNASIATLADGLRAVSPALYPSQRRLALESWYFRGKSMTWVWLVYLASVIFLLMSVIYTWDRARTVGMIVFVLAFMCHSVSLVVRWYISGRWPNANMFEALTTAAWFGGVAALVLEWIVRHTPFRNLFVLASAVASMGALMAAYFLPAQLDSGINNKMAALNDVWLYIHTNVIIWSYAVIALACVPALLLLRHRWCMAWDERTIPKARLLLLPIALCALNYTGYRLLMHILDDPVRELTGAALPAATGAFWASLMIVFLELSSMRTRLAAGQSVELAATGGASALMLSRPSASGFITPERPTMGQVFDGATMVLVELSFIMLWTGVVMGAIWADHSWGRPWGWDPKEVFALNTFIIFLILIHVRYKVRDKAFWTAVLAIVGFEVMMFNWIVVNFVITGLHSYA